jgi:hypothetical protein
MSHLRIPRDFRALAAQARGAGWTISSLGNQHLVWRSPQGGWVYSSSSPSDWRAPHKLRAALRRAGLPCTRS